MLAAMPAPGARRASVAQLEQTLRGLAAAHKGDTETAQQINLLDPTERISDGTLSRFANQYAPGPHTSVALQLLADRSSFLELPPSELPATPAPDAATQQKQLDRAEKFALDTLPRLPNLFATRTTYGFDDSPQAVKKGAWLEKAGLHLVSTSKSEVSVRSEHENQAAMAREGSEQQNGLMTWGEFGSALLLILSDSAHGTTTWSHWEQSPSGLVAVFHYEVPKSASHYEISAPVAQVQHLGGSGRWIGYGSGVGSNSPTPGVERLRPGYHGSFWVDPNTGAIERLTLVADLKEDSDLKRAAIVVDYGEVHIEDKSYVCPVHSLAFSDAHASVETTTTGATTEWLNENLFTNYHLFGASSRIVGEAAATEPEGVPGEAAAQPGKGPQPQTATTAAAPGTQSSEAAVPAAPAPAAQPSVEPGAVPATPPASSVSAIAPQQPAETAVTPETAASVGPGTANPPPNPTPTPIPAPVAAAPSSGNMGLTLHVRVNAVLVPVVVRDGRGQTVDDLHKEDFSVFDDGKAHPLSGFLVERRGVARSAAQGSSASGAVQRPPASAVPPSTGLPDRVTVFVFDDMHLNHDQIAYVRKAASATLDEALTGTDVAAVVTTSGKINSGLTRDRAKLSDAVMAVRPEGIYQAEASSCPRISYYQADQILNKRDGAALQDAIHQVMTICTTMPPSMVNLARSIAESTARRALEAGEQDVLSTYATISEIVRRMAKLPGQRTLILVSPGFLPIEQEARTAESKLIGIAAESNVTINALDAEGLYTTALKASDDVHNRDPVQMTDYRDNEMRSQSNAMGELADAAGGRFFHNSNDLTAGFRMLLEAPETVYVLELPLDGVREDGAWHRLSVKVDRGDTQIQAREGYFAPGGTAQKN